MPRQISSRTPKQDRSRASLERLLTATREMLSEGTFEALTIAGISKRSEVSVGSIYARFGGKDDLFLAVVRDVLGELDAEWESLVDETKARKLPLERQVPELIDTLAEYLKRHASILKPFMTKANDPQVATCGKASHLKMAISFQGLLLESRETILHPDPQHAVSACFSIAYAALARFLGLGSAADAAGEGDWAQLKQDLGIMCLGFLHHHPA
ncbi:TetR/AcrR family transcriptional regulator [Pseudomonas sp. BP8]|uniref:TetR/AcrR family transcriptional regulator n=1 Tax=Pseudomonas sp. BP8 TaxID=2817864 RepID=UPI001AEAADE3|nr:TetR/AcrR family transcriptional regulator [Pseudomonas sp. BP8]MBP2261558.1 AcrR family transcriptional regulator [Pseudomonas sp. BP8]HDS1733467.1 TetR/AcrR family transcriptional regulator [Pseudomonas putida]